MAIWDAFAVSPGHALIIPRRHVESWFEATEAEQMAIIRAIDPVKAAIEAKHQPDGYNIGINVGAAAGQTVFHLHVHFIPRYRGDVADPRGGVRHIILGKGHYQVGAAGGSVRDRRVIVTGGHDPFRPHLVEQLSRAVRADVATAFVSLSGMNQVLPHLGDMLERGGHLRFLTGDYLDFTDPDALTRLCDLADRHDPRVDLRVFETRGNGEETSFHPKAYILHLPNGDGVAYVGSSNLTEQALTAGIEWNLGQFETRDPHAFVEVAAAFDRLFAERSQRLDRDWIERYRARRRPPRLEMDARPEPAEPPPAPHEVQLEALAALDQTRRAANTAGLVVLATGLGKTWLAAFDSCDREAFQRILFVAHREEILNQAMETFRQIRPTARLGRFIGDERVPDAEILFASIQTVGRQRNLRDFPRDAFDYIVVDEFHHAAARTYRNLIDHFRPRFLLGLTATPERTDGGDLLALCQQNLVYRCDLFDGVRRGLLVPFHYFGIPDEVDYANIPWRNSRFDEVALTEALATQVRAQNALQQYRARAGTRTLAFCCSQRHADFMAEYFEAHGLRVAAVHSGPTSAPRSLSLERLSASELDVVFSVDMFNEGVDLPNVDTILMLRATESIILWLQQFGRGLRRAYGKERLTVIDYIGNHRIFLTRPRALFGLRSGDAEIARQLNLLEAGQAELPPGCEVTYDLKAITIMRSLLRGLSGVAEVEAFYRDFRERHGEPPTPLETFEEGYNPRKVGSGSWFRFVQAMGDLPNDRAGALEAGGEFLDELQTTQMTRSYKMLTLLAMLDRDAFPGEIDIDALTAGFADRASRSAALQADVGDGLEDRARLRKLIEGNPIAAWAGGRGAGGRAYFAYKHDGFRTTFTVPSEARAAFQEMVRELVDWRLGEYLSRPDVQGGDEGRIVCKVSHSGGKPILFLPSRERHPGIPSGWTDIVADDKLYRANFVKVAVNVVQEPDSEENRLPQILRVWFGPDAGLPGTTHQVAFRQDGDQWMLVPVVRPPVRSGPDLWHSYMREEIAPLFGLAFRGNIWRQGFVVEANQIFLFVTLEKATMPEDHRYEDRFLAPDVFQWQTQNRTTQRSRHGQMIQEHLARGLAVHLFVRRTGKIDERAAPFVYCGDVNFVDWEGDAPITVRWRLREPVPARLAEVLKVPDAATPVR